MNDKPADTTPVDNKPVDKVTPDKPKVNEEEVKTKVTDLLIQAQDELNTLGENYTDLSDTIGQVISDLGKGEDKTETENKDMVEGMSKSKGNEDFMSKIMS